jgi:hypothetical protein
MTFKALEPEAREMLNKSFKKFACGTNVNTVTELITEQALDFGVPAKAMLELLLIDILYAVHNGENDFKITTVFDKCFNEGKEKVRVFMLAVNGRKTKLFVDLELNTIIDFDDLPNFGAALAEIQKKYHKSDVLEIMVKKNSKGEKIDDT